ncbi:MAG: hypothetical protein AB7O04_03960 [Hyphomonadaceae bacterium]
MRWRLLSVAAAASLAACGSEPPQELAGLWGAGPANCEAGIGVRFASNSISAHFDGASQTLLDRPIYDVERRGARVRVRVTYELPGGDAVGSKGVLVLERGEDGWLRTMTHRLENIRTGSAHIRLNDDPVARAFRLRKCGPDAWIEGLRGRDDEI